MLCTTNDLIRTALKTDPTLTPANRTTILAAIKNHDKAPKDPELGVAPEPRILRRREAAARFGVSLRAVDNWTKAGILSKVKLPGHVRSCGFRESDIVALIEGRVL